MAEDDDFLMESPVKLRDPPVVQAAKEAFKQVKVKIDEKDEIFSIIHKLFEGQTVTSQNNGISFPNKKTAQKFMEIFLAELAKNGISDKFNTNVVLELDGKGIFFSKKEKVSSKIPIGGAGSRTLEDKENQFIKALEAGAAAINLKGENLKGPAGDFITQYRVWKEANDSEGRYPGFTLPLSMPDEKSARAFMKAFTETIGDAMPGLKLTVEVNRFTAKSKLAFVLPPVRMKSEIKMD